jgi:hypothetical protein
VRFQTPATPDSFPPALRVGTWGLAMPVHTTEIAELFDRLGNLLEVVGADSFRIREWTEHGIDG